MYARPKNRQADECEEVDHRVDPVEPVIERDLVHLKELARVEKYRVDFRDEDNGVVRDTTAHRHIVEEYSADLREKISNKNVTHVLLRSSNWVTKAAGDIWR